MRRQIVSIWWRTRGPSRLAADIAPLMAAFNAPRAPLKRGRPSDQAALLQEPHAVGGYRDALWRFTCAYQPAAYLRVVDRRIDAIRRVASGLGLSDQRTMAAIRPCGDFVDLSHHCEDQGWNVVALVLCHSSPEVRQRPARRDFIGHNHFAR